MVCQWHLVLLGFCTCVLIDVSKQTRQYLRPPQSGPLEAADLSEWIGLN
jgi:hypothetical protein